MGKCQQTNRNKQFTTAGFTLRKPMLKNDVNCFTKLQTRTKNYPIRQKQRLSGYVIRYPRSTLCPFGGQSRETTRRVKITIKTQFLWLLSENRIFNASEQESKKKYKFGTLSA